MLNPPDPFPVGREIEMKMKVCRGIIGIIGIGIGIGIIGIGIGLLILMEYR